MSARIQRIKFLELQYVNTAFYGSNTSCDAVDCYNQILQCCMWVCSVMKVHLSCDGEWWPVLALDRNNCKINPNAESCQYLDTSKQDINIMMNCNKVVCKMLKLFTFTHFSQFFEFIFHFFFVTKKAFFMIFHDFGKR